jgi:hypothetical protein
MSRESPRFLTLGEQRVFAAGEAIYAVKLKHVFACRPKCFRPPALFAVPIANRPRRRVIEDFGMRALASAQGVFISWIALTTTSGVCQLMHWLHTEALPTLSPIPIGPLARIGANLSGDDS